LSDEVAQKDDPGCSTEIEDFRREAHRAVDWMADYLGNSERYPVMSRARPGDIRSMVPADPPDRGEGVSASIEELERVVLPGITHWNSPEFMAYFAITGSPPGVLAEMYTAALNVNGMVWESSPVATELEAVTLDWLRGMLGLPEGLFGIVYDTASVSTLCALAAAREATGLGIRHEGFAGKPPLAVYASREAHSVVDKAAIVLGIGHENVRKIPTDDDFRMDVAGLRDAIDRDRASGVVPCCVVATVGTTSMTSVDPVDAIADVCAEESLWLHVDGAYAGVSAILPEMRWVLHGADRADSICVNPHKWLFVPVDFSAFYTRWPDMLRRAFSLTKPYLETEYDETAANLMDYGPQLGRRFRALKLWFVLRAYGVSGLQAMLRAHIDLARDFEEWVLEREDFEMVAPRLFSTVCFRAKPAGVKDEREIDRLNRSLLSLVNASGDAYISHTEVNGRYVLRLAIGHMRTRRQHVERVQDLLASGLAELSVAQS
jgi:aromatic-L-amino-acid decarboxylase